MSNKDIEFQEKEIERVITSVERSVEAGRRRDFTLFNAAYRAAKRLKAFKGNEYRKEILAQYFGRTRRKYSIFLENELGDRMARLFSIFKENKIHYANDIADHIEKKLSKRTFDKGTSFHGAIRQSISELGFDKAEHIVIVSYFNNAARKVDQPRITSEHRKFPKRVKALSKKFK